MKLTRKIMSIILTVMLVLSCIPMSAISVSAAENLTATIDTGKTVTLKDTNSDGYYEINNADELFAFSAIVNGGNNSINGILTNNIVINTNLISSSGSVNNGNFRRWTPIGTYSRPYAGHFKGNNKTISGLYSDNDYESGLFGYLNNTVENVGVIDSYIRGIENIGAIAGYNAGTIKNCYKTGVVRGDENVGGISGYNKGTVQNCYNSGNVDSNPNINCHYIVGCNNGTITNCYYDINRAGELSGTTYKTANDFASGEVAYLLGDAFGQTIGTDKLPVLGGQKVYNIKTCAGVSTDRYSNTNETVHPSHETVKGYDATCTEDGLTDGLKCSVCGFIINSQNVISKRHKFDNGFCTACETYEPAIDSNNDSYYEIDNAGKLYWFAQQVNSGNTSINAILTANITVNEGTITAESTDAREWTPISNDNNNYLGVFDGNNKTISGLYFNNSSANYIGLFGYAGANSEIKNAGVVNSYFYGNSYVGGVVGVNYHCRVTNCYNSGTISGYYCVGGMVGYNYYGRVTNCYNSGTISGDDNVSGVVGENLYGRVTNCYNTGIVSGTDDVGGVVGYIYIGTITNCYNSGSVSGTEDVGGVVGYNGNHTVTNCYNTGTVSGEKFVGGVVGRIYSSTITNSYNAGTVSGNSEVGGVVGYDSGGSTITNCYYLNTSYNGGINGKDIAGSAEAKTSEQFANGEVAYLLGEAFGQTIGTDTLPIFGGAKVYYGYKCGEANKIYSNKALFNDKTTHICGDDLRCEICGVYESATLNNDGYYEIDSASKLMWFAEQINNGSIRDHKVKLTKDVVILENVVWIPISLPDGAISTFDGNGHSITMNQNLDNGTTSGASFGLYLSCNYSTIQNLVLKGNVVVNTTGNVGGVSATSYRTTFRNVTSYMNITNNCTTGGNVGGIVGYFGGKHANGLYSLIENCAVYADVSGYIAGGIVGQGWNGTQYYDISNCAYVGNVTGTNIAGAIVGYQNTDSNTSRFTNIYWLEDDNLGFYGLRDTANQIYTNTEAKTAEQFASGEVAYLLGGAFGQTLGTDDYPVLGGAKVYYGYENCSSTEKAYSNNKMSEEIVPHNYENGICTVCDAYLPATDSDGDSYYEIDNAGKLYWFAQQVNNGNYYINAILTADITVNEGEITENSTNAREWIPIGGLDYGHDGIFDGNNKTISGLYFNKITKGFVGLIGWSGENFEIKNVGIVNSYINGNPCTGGVVGYNSGTVTNCYNTGTVSGDQNVGGVVGYNDGTLTNCYNTGSVSGYWDVGGVVGDNYGTITNCYNTGTVSSYGSYVGGVVGYINEGTVTNCYNTGTIKVCDFPAGGISGFNSRGIITSCYYLNTTHTGGINSKDIAGSAEAKTAEQFANGEVAYLLGEAFGQTIGTDELPVLGGAKVYCGYTDCALSEKAYSNSPIETPSHNHILGDIDLDGIVSIRDVSTLSKHLASCTTLTDCQLSTADANGDGEININDATYIQKMLVELV